MKRCLAMAPILAALLILMIAVAPASALDEADRLFMVGERALADRFYPVARRALERFVAQYPKDPRGPRALVMLGKARLALNDAQSALEAFARAQGSLTAPADLLETKFWQAEALFRLKRFGEARTAYDEIVRTDAASPLAPEALYGYAWTELELQRPEPAVTALREFLTTWPEHALAPSATLHLARAQVELKRAADALPLLTAFATKYPNSKLLPDAQYLLGWVKVNSGDPRGGLADLRAFVAANPSHEQAPAAQKLINQALGRSGNKDEMLDAYKALMEQNPTTAEDLYRAADIAKQLSRPRDVDAAWRRLKSEFPEHALTRRLALELANAAFKQKSWKDASALGATAAQSAEDTVRADAWLLIGESELKLKRFPQAAKAFEAVGAVGDVEAGVRYRALAGLGLAREEQKEWKGALTAYEAVAERSPDSGLREWARERVTAMKTQLKASPATPAAPKRSEPAKPSNKPTGKKS
jgi:cellulose synthase operon protein C